MALLTVLVALPVAALVVPHTTSYVLARALADLDLGTAQAAGLVRAGGLALPALLLVLPPAALAARRFPAWSVLLAGLLCVLAGAVAVRQAGSVPLVGVARAMQGAGAGAIVPATLVLAWERRSRALVCAWAGLLVGAIILAMPLALQTVPAVGTAADASPSEAAVAGGLIGRADWRAVLHPPLWLIGAALLVAVAGAFSAGRRRGSRSGENMPSMSDAERTQLLLPLVPVGGFAFLAVVTTYDRWSVGALLVVAVIGLVALLGLAVVGTRGAATGGPLRCSLAMVTTGLLVIPVVAPVAGLISTRIEPHDVPVLPFALGAAAALAAAVATLKVNSDGFRAAVLVGHGLVIVALLSLLTVGAGSGSGHLALALIPLGAGAGIALAAAMWEAGPGSATFGLALCFPAVLIGYLVVGPMQMIKVNTVRAAGGGRQEVIVALTSAFRLWLVVAVVVAALMTVLVALAGRRVLLGAGPAD